MIVISLITVKILGTDRGEFASVANVIENADDEFLLRIK